mgnify:CR=1 FL=1
MKGISNIIGTIFLLFITVSLFAVFLFLTDKQANVTQQNLQVANERVQHALFLIGYENNKTYLIVTSPVTITYIIYPNGSIVKANITVSSGIPIEKITGGQEWAIVVTNQGTWYNVSNVSIPVIK